MLLILKPLSKSFYPLKSDPQNKMKQNIVVHAGLLHYMQLPTALEQLFMHETCLKKCFKSKKKNIC